MVLEPRKTTDGQEFVGETVPTVLIREGGGTCTRIGVGSRETERHLKAVIDLSHRRGRERSQDAEDIALVHREQVCCDERRIPREPTDWLSRQFDQMLRGLVYASGVAGDLGDDRVRHPSVVPVILNDQSGAY